MALDRPTPEGDVGVIPRGYSDPVENPLLPAITAATDDDPVPVDRLADEPGWEFEGAEDVGQNDLVHPDLQVKAVSSAVRSLVSSAVGISLTDYSRNPQAKGWGAPCTAPRATVQAGAASVNVDRRIAELVFLIMRHGERHGYRHRKADTGAYNCRKIAGTNSWSNHAWALAIDINWQSNPFTSPLRTDIPEWYRFTWNRYGFAWGGNYSGKKDAMHFEFMGTPAQLQRALDLARKEIGDVVAPPPPPVTGAKPGDGILERGDSGESVKTLQRVAKAWYPKDLGYVTVDGEFGPDTERAVKFVQAKFGLTQDGVAGPQTLGKLGLGYLK